MWKVDLYNDWWQTKIIQIRTGQVVALPLLHDRGDFTITTPIDDDLLEQVRKTQLDNVRTVTIRDDADTRLFDGVVAEPNGYLLSKTRAGETMSWSGHDAYWLASRRSVVPDPARPDGPWTTARHSETGKASTVAANFLTKHFGALATSDRQGAEVIDDEVGRVGTWSAAAGELLTDVIPRIAGVDVAVTASVTPAGVPQFRCAARRNRTSTIVIAEADLEELHRRRIPRSVTSVTAVSGGDPLRGGTGAAGLERIEKVVNASADERQSTIDDELAAGDAQWSITGVVSTLGASKLHYLRDVTNSDGTVTPGFRLGDLVSVLIDNVRVPVPVTGVSLSWQNGRAVASPVLGDANRDTVRRLFRRQRDLERSLRKFVI